MTEVATFRSDGAYSDGRHPDAVRYTKSAEEDVQAERFHDQWVVARCGSRGAVRIAQRSGNQFRSSLRLGGDRFRRRNPGLGCGNSAGDWEAGARFEEDHLRILRGIRFAARFGFELEGETKRAMRAQAAR